MTVKLIVDASFILECIRRRIDIIKELEDVLNSRVKFVILKPVYNEILRLSAGSGRKSCYARLAIQLLNRIEIELIEVEGDERPVDAIIEQYAYKLKTPVATNDLKLKKRLVTLKIPVLYIRNLSKVEVEGGEYLDIVRG